MLISASLSTFGRTAGYDFDGDGRDDISVFRPSEGVWYISKSTGGYAGFAWGLPIDQPAAADYDGDGHTDIAIYRNGDWWIWNSGSQTIRTFNFGLAGDIPVPGLFDNDARADIAVYRPSSGEWYWVRSGDGGISAVKFGMAGDVPVPSDFDGDGRVDLNVFRPSNGTWHWLNSTDSSYRYAQFGLDGDQPVAGDFDGDGRSDIAVWRPSDTRWHLLKSSDSSYHSFQFGLPTDIPVTADYDGDGRTDVALFRPADGTWHLVHSGTGNYAAVQFGLSSDIPIPSKMRSRSGEPGPLPTPSPTPSATPVPTPTATPTPAPSPTPGPSFTCDYYASPNGSDAGTGTSSNPWSLQAALNKTTLVRNGKTLCLRGGTYRGKFSSTLSGGGVVRSAPGEWAVIDGNQTAAITVAINSSTRTIPVTTTQGMASGNTLAVDTELMQIDTVNGPTSVTVNRGWSPSIGGATSHNAGATVRLGGNQFSVSGSGTTYRDFEVTNSYAQRDLEPGSVSGQGCCGFYAFLRGAGVSTSGNGNSFVNLLVHNNLDGFFTGSGSSNTLIYGVVTYNNGAFYGDNTGSGNGLYLENTSGYSRIHETFSLNNFNQGAQLYGVSGPYVGGDVQGSAFVGSGSPLNVANRNMLYGPDGQASPTGTVNESHFYHTGSSGYNITFGYGLGIVSGAFTNNFLGGGNTGFEVGNVTNLTSTGNKIFNSGVNVLTRQANYTWNNNTYYNTAASAAKFGNGTIRGNQTFSNWKTATGFDPASRIESGNIPTTVIVRPNSYQAGRANIVVYASGQTSVNVNLSAIGLSNGQRYVIKNAFNWNGSDVASGTFNSSSPSIVVPINSVAKSVAAPVGISNTPATTCPQMCLFVVVPN